MPYIKKTQRTELQFGRPPENPGEINYLVSCVFAEYLRYKGLSYQTVNDIVGAGTHAVQEFIRRISDKYEDEKIKENGDVYPKKVRKKKY